MGKNKYHRGSVDRPGEFEKKFILARIEGFQKDIGICLTSIPSSTRSGLTHESPRFYRRPFYLSHATLLDSVC